MHENACTAENAALRRLELAGAAISSMAQNASELVVDWTREDWRSPSSSSSGRRDDTSWSARREPEE